VTVDALPASAETEAMIGDEMLVPAATPQPPISGDESSIGRRPGAVRGAEQRRDRRRGDRGACPAAPAPPPTVLHRSSQDR